jgi:hypothetical protein
MNRSPDKLVLAWLACCLAFATPAIAQPRLSDARVREQIIAESIAAYPGNCPCPYNVDRGGRSCGQRSAWSKRGGQAPACYPDDVSDDQVRAWRARNDQDE